MPAGSHMGSGGSHFGGSSSGGGSHFGGPTHSHYNSNGRITIHLGNRVLFLSGKGIGLIATLGMLMIFALFFAGITNATFVLNGKDIQKIKTSFNEYQTMVQYANEHEEYQTDAYVTDYFYNEEANKYYITFEFGNSNYPGYSFSVYTDSEAQRLKHKTIKIALNNPNTEIDALTDAIPMDFINISLEDDGEYTAKVEAKNTSKIIMIVGYGVSALCLAGLIVALLKNHNFKLEKADETSENPTDEKPEQKKKIICPYCGSRVKDDEDKCKNCGATLNK